MKIFLSSLLLLGVSSIAVAADPAAPKMGIVDMREVLQKSPQATALNAQLEKQFKPREATITAAQKTLQTDVDKLNKDGAVMNANDRTQLQDKIVKQKAELQTLIGTFQQDLNNTQNQGMQAIFAQASAIINKIGKDESYSLIIPKEVALYFKPEQDITARISQNLNAAKDSKPAVATDKK